MLQVKFSAYPHCNSLPEYQTEGSAGLDMFSAKSVIIRPGRWELIPCGFAVAIPEGYEGQVRPRSGLALRRGLTILNSPGTIDSDYRGEVHAMIINLSTSTQSVDIGDRIAQLVISPVARVSPVHVLMLDETARGEGAFGSTGV